MSGNPTRICITLFLVVRGSLAGCLCRNTCSLCSRHKSCLCSNEDPFPVNPFVGPQTPVESVPIVHSLVKQGVIPIQTECGHTTTTQAFDPWLDPSDHSEQPDPSDPSDHSGPSDPIDPIEHSDHSEHSVSIHLNGKDDTELSRAIWVMGVANIVKMIKKHRSKIPFPEIPTFSINPHRFTRKEPGVSRDFKERSEGPLPAEGDTSPLHH